MNKTLATRVAWARQRPGLEMTQSELARRAGVSQGTIANIESGLRKKPRDLVAIATALGVRPEWLADGRPPVEGLVPTKRGPGADLDHDMSLSRNYSDPPNLEWGELMGADLTKPFHLAVMDGAFGAEIPIGSVMRFDPELAPVGGRPVLVRDRSGKHYIRDYQEASGGRWQAIARARGFAAFDSVDDGLQLVAVMRGFDYP